MDFAAFKYCSKLPDISSVIELPWVSLVPEIPFTYWDILTFCYLLLHHHKSRPHFSIAVQIFAYWLVNTIPNENVQLLLIFLFSSLTSLGDFNAPNLKMSSSFIKVKEKESLYETIDFISRINLSLDLALLYFEELLHWWLTQLLTIIFGSRKYLILLSEMSPTVL